MRDAMGSEGGRPRSIVLAAATAGSDVDAAETAASLELLAIAVYGQVAQLPLVQEVPAPAGTTVAALFTSAAQHHADHLTSFNAAAVRLGGREQPGADATVSTTIVEPALAAATTPAELIAVLVQIELIAAETYASLVTTVADRQLRNSLAGITGVEAQHAAVLLTSAALLAQSRPSLVSFPWLAADLPASAATEGNPSPFLKTDQARPTTEGALR